MKIGFYYHIPVLKEKENIYLPSFLGLFIDSIADEVERVYLFMHVSELEHPSAGFDYVLRSKNISLISLGKDRPAYIKGIFPSFFFKEAQKHISSCDAIIVRGPSPLMPYFSRFKYQSLIVYMLVGSYESGSKHIKLPWYKSRPVKWLLLHIHRSILTSISGANILVNSQQLQQEYGIYSKSSKMIYTTTLTANDFYHREDTCLGLPIRLLYVGRLDWAKGLKEIEEAFINLCQKSRKYEIHFVGWEEQVEEPVMRQLLATFFKNGLSDKVFFHGRKKAGEELFTYYRNSDIYLLPSYHEGFPRTIWEAFANCIPVITSRVGSIPYYLEDKVHALIIEPKNSDQLLDAINEIIGNSNLRKKLIKNGLERVSEIRLDIQAKSIIQYIHEKMA